ncbi:hypothetical protein GF386_03155 [Candidatus Pacearchaeota archaeon]|nr:hypothetical protein [Candidatus Pacearchaeota archaeon]MBD3283138.1 hypothetical protein [Candidatus Pacearchaeota archaeon]
MNIDEIYRYAFSLIGEGGELCSLERNLRLVHLGRLIRVDIGRDDMNIYFYCMDEERIRFDVWSRNGFKIDLDCQRAYDSLSPEIAGFLEVLSDWSYEVSVRDNRQLGI